MPEDRPNIDQRLEALSANLELMSGMVNDLLANSARDGESIRALARIAEIHDGGRSTFEDDAGDRQ